MNTALSYLALFTYFLLQELVDHFLLHGVLVLFCKLISKGIVA